MLFFLRQLRRLELRKRSGQYFVYALGEIVLIVAGILIALQISEWNQERKDRAEERVMLSRLNEELDANLDKLGRLLNNAEKKRLALDQVALAFDGEPVEDSTVFLNNVIVSTFNSWTIQRLQRLIFDELNNTGKLVLIQRVDLRDSITELYSDVDLLEEILLARTTREYPVLVYKLIPRQNEGRVKEGLSEEHRNKIVAEVLSTDLRGLLNFEENRGKMVRNFWEGLETSITETKKDIETYLEN